MLRTSTGRTAILGLLFLVVVAGGFVLVDLQANGPVEKFCTLGLPYREINGRDVAIQEADPTGGGCNLAETMPGMDTLGLDCKVRAPDGSVVTTVRSSRADGTCGRDSPP